MKSSVIIYKKLIPSVYHINTDDLNSDRREDLEKI